jgi:hypothetical protein
MWGLFLLIFEGFSFFPAEALIQIYCKSNAEVNLFSFPLWHNVFLPRASKKLCGSVLLQYGNFFKEGIP